MNITPLHGYIIKELINFNINSKYTRLALAAITMRYTGYSNSQIVETTGLNKCM